MSTISLPQELLHLIVQHAKEDSKTLLKLCLVSRILLPEAQRVLYTEVTLSGLNREVIGLTSKAMMFFNTMTSYNPSLAWSVHSLSYYPSGRRRGYDWWALMNRSLQLMVNLKSFTLEGTHLPSPTSIFSDCLFQLHNFSWNDYSRGLLGASPDEGHLIRFLATQQELRSLSLHIASTRIEQSICPRLETLIGGTRTIMNILPGRNVTKLVWQTQETFWEKFFDMECLSEELSHVQTFVLGGILPRQSLIIYVPYLRRVQNLRLFGQFPSLSLEIELSYISSLPLLQIFVWSPGQFTRAAYHALVPVDTQRTFILKWYQAIPALRAVYFARCLPREDVNCYSLWTRDGKESHVSPTEFMREGNIDA